MKKLHSEDLKDIAVTAMRKYGFEPRFPDSVIEEVRTMSPPSFETLGKNTRDLRTLLWSSIDNHDSMDLDQMEFCERSRDGEIHVKLAIADVDFYVWKQSRTDTYAGYNGTSVYLGVETFPMLPDKLSKGISSLLPGPDHLAIVIEYTILTTGDIRPGEIYRAIVSNKAKLIYEEVGDWLEGSNVIPKTVREVAGLEEQIHIQCEAAQRLKKSRMEQGALDLETIEANAVMEGDLVKDLVVQKKNLARTIIEELMVAANGAMVNYLGKAGIPMIQRVVRTPRYWGEIIRVAASFGQHLPADPDSKALSIFLNYRKEADPEHFPDLSLTIVKLIGPGEYMTLEPGEPPFGHFGLAVTDYTHGTAPNRRYVDLIIQRLLKSVIDKVPSPYTDEELIERSTWLSGREKGSKKVERFMRKAAAAVLLQDRIGEQFDALVTGASEKGTYARLITPPAEGRIVQGEHGLRVGQKVRLRLLKTDPYNGFIDFGYRN